MIVDGLNLSCCETAERFSESARRVSELLGYEGAEVSVVVYSDKQRELFFSYLYHWVFQHLGDLYTNPKEHVDRQFLCEQTVDEWRPKITIDLRAPQDYEFDSERFCPGHIEVLNSEETILAD